MSPEIWHSVVVSLNCRYIMQIPSRAFSIRYIPVECYIMPQEISFFLTHRRRHISEMSQTPVLLELILIRALENDRTFANV